MARRFLATFALMFFLCPVCYPLGGAGEQTGTLQKGTAAIPVADFLNSLGVVSTFPDRGQPLPKTVEMVRFGGFRWVRGGIEGLSTRGPTTVQTYLDLHQQTGVKFDLGSGQRRQRSQEAHRVRQGDRQGRRPVGL